jgi:hypothetical protein
VDEYRAPWPAFVLVARSSMLKEHGPLVDRLLKVVRDQASGLMSKKDAPAIIAQRYGLALDDASAWFGNVRWNCSGRIDPLTVAEVTTALHANGLLSEALDAEECSGRIIHQG